MNHHPIGVYVHIPFCVAKCPYCDFYSRPFDSSLADAYVSALGRALRQAPCPPGTVADTVYFGGGTPSLMGAQRLGKLVSLLNESLPLAPGAELTLEANPGSLQPALLESLLEAGFTRISFGVQSLQPTELAALGRRHTPKQALLAINEAHKAGFGHISADLMLGVPHQTAESLAATLESLGALPLDHVSAYLLKVEEHTPFARRSLSLPDEDETAERYLQCVRTLEAAGFAQYEISNFARPGGESRHNLKYWRCEDYLGLGPAAHSFVQGRRFAFPRDLQGFATAQDPFALAQQDGAGGGAEEYAMLRLRLREGLRLADYAARSGRDAAELLQKARPLMGHGLVRLEGDVLSLTPQGFLLSNAVTGALLF